MADYDIQEHIHRYAVWTAARASQRNFTTTANIRRAIEESGLRDFKLAKEPGFQGAGLRQVNWTKLGEAEYYKLIEKLRTWMEPEPFWKI